MTDVVEDFGGDDLEATPTLTNGAHAKVSPLDNAVLITDPRDFAGARGTAWWDADKEPAHHSDRVRLMNEEAFAHRVVSQLHPGLLDSPGVWRDMIKRGELSRFVRDWVATPGTLEMLANRLRGRGARSPAASNDHSANDRNAARFHRAPSLVEAILKNAKLPWIELGLEADGDALVRVRLGAYVVLIGSEGSGKSSLLLQLGSVFARGAGVFVYFTVELDEEEAAGRLISQYAGESWEDALRGRVAASDMRAALDLPRFVILAGDNATISNLDRTVAELRAEFPERPIVVGVDYIQAMDGAGREERARVSGVSKDLRRAGKRLGVVVLGVSQTSRANRKPLRDGEAVGADTVTAGAETSQLERDAYVTLALGGLRPNPDGTTGMDLSIGKTRMGQGDRVVPVVYDGRTGRFAIVGASRSGSEVRAEREASRNTGRVHAVELAIPGKLAELPAPTTRDELARELHARKADVSVAVRTLLAAADGTVVQVRLPEEPGARGGRNGALRLWTRAHAIAAGLDIVPTGFGGSDA